MLLIFYFVLFLGFIIALMDDRLFGLAMLGVLVSVIGYLTSILAMSV